MIQVFLCVCIVQVQRGEKYNFKQVSQLNKNQTIQYVASKSAKMHAVPAPGWLKQKATTIVKPAWAL